MAQSVETATLRKPVVAYIRVSTEKQDVEVQRMLIETWARSNNVTIDEWFSDVASGAEVDRADFQRLWIRVRENTVGTIVVAELSRLSRSLKTLIAFVYDCIERNVTIVSLREAWLHTALQNELLRPLLISVFAALYEIERQLVSERTKAGLAKARASGKHIGHPRALNEKEVKLLIAMYKQRAPVSRIALRLGVSRATVYRYLREAGLKPRIDRKYGEEGAH